VKRRIQGLLATTGNARVMAPSDITQRSACKLRQVVNAMQRGNLVSETSARDEVVLFFHEHLVAIARRCWRMYGGALLPKLSSPSDGVQLLFGAPNARPTEDGSPAAGYMRNKLINNLYKLREQHGDTWEINQLHRAVTIAFRDGYRTMLHNESGRRRTEKEREKAEEPEVEGRDANSAFSEAAGSRGTISPKEVPFDENATSLNESDDLDLFLGSPADGSDSAEQLERIRDAFSCLSEDEADVIRLSLDGMNSRKIAEFYRKVYPHSVLGQEYRVRATRDRAMARLRESTGRMG
jgi:hypothetical protein